MKTLSEFKKDYEKKVIKKYLGNSLRYKLTKSLDEAIVALRELRNEFDGEYDNLKIIIDGEPEGWDSCSVCVDLIGERLETAEEFNKRVELEYRRYQNEWDRERKHYEYLKKKFEGYSVS
jgi:DNA repair exonuclease SbcCD ATPase subunit